MSIHFGAHCLILLICIIEMKKGKQSFSLSFYSLQKGFYYFPLYSKLIVKMVSSNFFGCNIKDLFGLY
jgi:hypothetical protein